MCPRIWQYSNRVLILRLPAYHYVLALIHQLWASQSICNKLYDGPLCSGRNCERFSFEANIQHTTTPERNHFYGPAELRIVICVEWKMEHCRSYREPEMFFHNCSDRWILEIFPNIHQIVATLEAQTTKLLWIWIHCLFIKFSSFDSGWTVLITSVVGVLTSQPISLLPFAIMVIDSTVLFVPRFKTQIFVAHFLSFYPTHRVLLQRCTTVVSTCLVFHILYWFPFDCQRRQVTYRVELFGMTLLTWNFRVVCSDRTDNEIIDSGSCKRNVTKMPLSQT